MNILNIATPARFQPTPTNQIQNNNCPIPNADNKRLKNELELAQGVGVFGALWEACFGLLKTTKENSLQAFAYILSSIGELFNKIIQLKNTSSLLDPSDPKEKKTNSIKIVSLVQKIMASGLFAYLIFDLFTKKGEQNLFNFKLENPITDFLNDRAEYLYNLAGRSLPKQIKDPIKEFLEKSTEKKDKELKEFIKGDLILGIPSFLTIIPGTINLGLTLSGFQSAENNDDCQEIKEHKQIAISVFWQDLVCFLETGLLIFGSPITRVIKSLVSNGLIAEKIKNSLGTVLSIASLTLNSLQCEKISKESKRKAQTLQ